MLKLTLIIWCSLSLLHRKQNPLLLFSKDSIPSFRNGSFCYVKCQCSRQCRISCTRKWDKLKNPYSTTITHTMPKALDKLVSKKTTHATQELTNIERGNLISVAEVYKNEVNVRWSHTITKTWSWSVLEMARKWLYEQAAAVLSYSLIPTDGVWLSVRNPTIILFKRIINRTVSMNRPTLWSKSSSK